MLIMIQYAGNYVNSETLRREQDALTKPISMADGEDIL
jgi:hypothetical protein